MGDFLSHFGLFLMLAGALEAVYILSGAATCSEGFVTCFLNVPLACLGSMAAAVQPNSLGTLRKHFAKPSEQVATPPGKYPYQFHS